MEEIGPKMVNDPKRTPPNSAQLAMTNLPCRIPAIDALRVLALALLIIYHLGMGYVPDWGWHIKSSYQWQWLKDIMLWSNQWRMSLLFTLSGMATAIMLLRQPCLKVAKTRLLHLGVPLVAGLLFWVVPQVFVELKEKGYLQSVTAFEFYWLYINPFNELPHNYIRLEPANWTWNHLWFLPYMLCYCLIAVGVSYWLPLRIWQWRSATKAQTRLAIIALVLLPTFAYWLIGECLYASYPVTFLFIGDWFSHASYGFSFVLGMCFMILPRFWRLIPSLCWWMLALAIATFTLIVLKLSGRSYLTDMPNTLNGLLWSANRWFWLLAILGLGARYLNKKYYWVDLLRHRVFCYYILHQTVIVVTLYALKDKGWYLAEPLSVFVVTLIICEVGYQLGKRYRLLGWSLGIFRHKY